MTLPARWIRSSVEACQHPRFISHKWDGLDMCTCCSCAHKWVIVHTPVARTPFDDLVAACRRERIET